MSILRLTDAYKLGRYVEYPKGTTHSNEVLVARDCKYLPKDIEENVKKHGFIVMGIYYAIKQVNKAFKDEYLKYGTIEKIRDNVENDFISVLNKDIQPEFLNSICDLYTDYIALGKELPLKFEHVEEGTLLPLGTPILKIINTDERFFWLPNFIETLFISYCWLPIVNATKNFYLKCMLTKHQEKTSTAQYVEYQAHDFSMRGNQGIDGSTQVSMGHLASFRGTDTLIYLDGNIEYEIGDDPFFAGSVSAFEHASVTTNIQHNIQKGMDLRNAEKEALKRFLTEVYPTGIVSYVADSYDFWQVIDILSEIKDIVLSRYGKLVVRPDSDDPFMAICGRPDAENEWQRMGLIRSLDKIFGSTVNSKGYKVLNDKIGAIYGDGMYYENADAILTELTQMGYSTENVVFGFGVFWQSFATRDNLGIALKTTFAVVDGKDIPIRKDPKTTSGLNKKSPYGDVKVIRTRTNEIYWFDAETDLVKKGFEAFPEDDNNQIIGEHLLIDYHEHSHKMSDIRKNIDKNVQLVLSCKS